MRRTILTALLLAAPVWGQTAGLDCYCTDTTGGRVEMGERACLSVNGRAFIAVCAMSQNVPAWRDTGETCLTG